MLTRRAMLTSTPALALAVATPTAAACVMPIAATGDDSALFAVIDSYHAATAAVATTNSNLDWLAAEWKHRWPLAPPELFWNKGAEKGTWTKEEKAERDMAGRYIMRNVSECCPKRWSRKFIRAGGQTCFTIQPSTYFAERLEWWREHKPVGRTAKALARNIAYRAKLVAEDERGLALALEYEAERKRIYNLSGAYEVVQRQTDALNEQDRLSKEVLRARATTLEGIVAKAEFYLTLPRAVGIFAEDKSGTWAEGNVLSFGWSLSEDITRLRKAGAVVA